MTICIYYSNPYISEFAANVVSIKDDWIILDQTAFYPGGGGQEADVGTIEGIPVIEMKQSGNTISHRVPNHTFAIGQNVQGIIDWKRRYELMMGHTGEHLLFSHLSKICPDIKLVKISIGQDRKSLTIKGALDWDALAVAQERVLDSIEANFPISIFNVSKDDVSLDDARIKIDRIHGNDVRLVDIGDIDRAACSGIHVRDTSELGMLLITRLVSARPDADFEIEFEIGDVAKRTALNLSITALQSAEALGARVQDLNRALGNVLNERDVQAQQLRMYEEKALDNLTPSRIGDVNLYSGLFGAMDKRTLLNAAARFTKNHAACVLGSAGERFMLVIACSPDVDIDCADLINRVLEPEGGRGGGKRHFATGGAPSPERGEDIMVRAIVKLRTVLEDTASGGADTLSDIK